MLSNRLFSSWQTIQGRITLTIFVGAILLFSLVGYALERRLTTSLDQQFNASLLAKAMTLVTLTTQNSGQVTFDFADEFMPEFESPDDPSYFQLWLEKGEFIERSHSLKNDELPKVTTTIDHPHYQDILLPNGKAGRLVVVLFVPHMEDDSTEKNDDDEKNIQAMSKRYDPTLRIALAVALPLTNHLATITSLRWLLFLSFLFLTTAIAILAWGTVRWGLKPIRDISRQVRNLDEKLLNQQVSLSAGSSELSPVAMQINALLGRLEKAFLREKGFSNNVAHELRTPITELRVMSEVALRWPDNSNSKNSFADDVLAVTHDMEVMVNNLLTLARSEARQLSMQIEKMCLAEAVDEVWNLNMSHESRNTATLMNVIDKSIFIETDRKMFELIVRNLLSNAVEYGCDSGIVSVSAKEEGHTMTLIVENSTTELAQDDLPFIFDRFWRKDSNRTQRGHAGLGLTLVKSLSEFLGFNVRCEITDRSIFSIRVAGL